MPTRLTCCHYRAEGPGALSGQCTTHRWMRHARKWWLVAEEQSWQNLMFWVPLGVPVHPDDRGLLGMRWRDKVYVDNRP